VRYAARQPEQVGGVVLIDGAYPIAMLDDAGEQKVREQFRRLGWIMRILAALGRSARMSPGESADVVIDMDAVNGELGRDFAALACPTVFVVGTGAHSGRPFVDGHRLRPPTNAQLELSAGSVRPPQSPSCSRRATGPPSLRRSASWSR
jgi:pimeloyl-ACP methyl ester carboxylesterase